MAKEITVRDVRKQIQETAKSEFKPVLGTNVEKDEKKQNSEAYSDAAKRVQEYLKGLENEGSTGNKAAAGGENRGMTSLLYDQIADNFKERVKAQLKGYDSTEAEKLHKDDEKAAKFGTDDDVKAMKDIADVVKKEKDELKTQGLVGSKQDKKEVEKHTHTALGENQQVMRLRFKHTQFLSENDMRKHIPDNYKVEGKKFYMTDNAGNDYLVEWSYGKANVLSANNEAKVNEQVAKMKKLMNYDGHADYATSDIYLRESADNGMNDVLRKMRTICSK